MSKVKNYKSKPPLHNSKIKLEQTKRKKEPEVKSSFLDILNNRFTKHYRFLFYFILSVSLFFSLLLFNLRISEGGDDSNYIYVAYRYSKEFLSYYYFAQPPFYPILLSVFIRFAGINLFLLKSLSIIFNFSAVYFLLKGFYKKIPSLIFFPVVFLTTINSHFLYYASQTYTEAIFVLFQALLIYFIAKLPEEEKKLEDVLANWKLWLAIGSIIFLMDFTRRIGIVVLPSLIIYLLFNKRFYGVAAVISAFSVFKIPFEVVKNIIWPDNSTSETASFFMKNPYHPHEGTEDFAGIVTRLFKNADLYLSKRFFQIIGFKSELSTEVSTLLTILVTGLFLLGLYFAIKNKNQLLIFSGIYTCVMVITTFLAIQIIWDQPRLIHIYLPLMLFIILYGIYELVKKSSFPIQSLFLYLLIAMFATTIIQTFDKAKDNFPGLIKNLKGDKFYGYTPDWVNFLKMSEWCGKNLSKEFIVGSRKPSMSFIYSGGREFYPLYRVLSTDADTVLTLFKEAGVSHVILASLRRNPKVADGTMINTIHRMLNPVATKYPGKLQLIHQEGTWEPAYLYKINY